MGHLFELAQRLAVNMELAQLLQTEGIRKVEVLDLAKAIHKPRDAVVEHEDLLRPQARQRVGANVSRALELLTRCIDAAVRVTGEAIGLHVVGKALNRRTRTGEARRRGRNNKEQR